MYIRKDFAYIVYGLILAFLANTFGPVPVTQAQEFLLPKPGTMVALSPVFNPPILKGLKVHPDNPFRFNFILDKGDSQLNQAKLKDESSKLIKYFLASLTIPEKDLWVNLSPYEKNRIVPESFGQTEMGRDLLAEDYILKQITASLIYPEGETGKKFWAKVYAEAEKRFHTTNIPVNTFNKVWIVPEKAVVYENAKAGTAYVVDAKLKVMLEEDYLALQKQRPHSPSLTKEGVRGSSINVLGSQIAREIVIPELAKEVNTGRNFAQLRQVYNSLILATWYKKKIKDSILAQVYEDKKKVAGIVSLRGSETTEAIYQRYLQAFKKGAYDYIKEEVDPMTQQVVPRKYFSGGLLLRVPLDVFETGQRGITDKSPKLVVNVDFAMAVPNDENRTNEMLETKRMIAWLLTRPSNYDWQAHAGELPELKGRLIGFTDEEGRINITPISHYNFRWLTLGFVGSGWRTVVTDCGIKNGIYELTVELTKEGQSPVTRVFQLGRFTRTIRGNKNQTGKSIEILDMSDRLALRAISAFILKQENLENFDGLKGMTIGITDEKGTISFSPVEYYKFDWPILGFNEAGWKAVLVEVRKSNEIYEITVELTKEGQPSKTRVFQIGHFVRKIHGSGAQKGKVIEVLNIDDSLALEGIKDLTKPELFEKYKTEGGVSLDGLRIRSTNSSGVAFFPIDTNFSFYWQILGFKEDGWGSIITKSGFENDGIYYFQVRLTKKYNKPIIRNFRIRPDVFRMLPGTGKEKGKTKKVLEIISMARNINFSPYERQKMRVNNFITGIAFSRDVPGMDFIDQEIKGINDQQGVFFRADGLGNISLKQHLGKRPRENLEIEFQGLKPNMRYRIIPLWVENRLLVYFKEPHGPTRGYDVGILRNVKNINNKKVLEGPLVISEDFNQARKALENQDNKTAWELPTVSFEKQYDDQSLHLPVNLKSYSFAEIPPWFNISDLKKEQERLKDIYTQGEDFFSLKTNRYLNDFSKRPLDPQILAEIRAFLNGRKVHKQSLRINGKKIVISDEWTLIMSLMLDWTLWHMAGLDPREGKGKQLANYYVSVPGNAGIKSVSGKDMLFSKYVVIFLSKMEQDPSIEDSYRKIVHAVWQWMFYDSLYNSNFSLEENTIRAKDIYWGVFPFHQVVAEQSGHALKDYQQPYNAVNFILEGMREFMPYKISQEMMNGNESPSRDRRLNELFAGSIVNRFLSRFNGKPEKRLTQWHVNLVYETLSAAAVQGPQLKERAIELWDEFREQVKRKGLLGQSHAMAASPIGGIDLNPNKMDLKVTNDSSGQIQFHIDPAQLAQVQNAPGFVPVIISIQPLNNLRQFLGITAGA